MCDSSSDSGSRQDCDSSSGSGSRQDGVAAVEFAIVGSLLFLLLFGIVEFGMAWHRRQGLEAAAREGARLASVGADQQAIGDRVRAAQSLFDPTDVTVGTDPSTNPPCANGADTVSVTATVAGNDKYAITIPLWGHVQITYAATGVFKCE